MVKRRCLEKCIYSLDLPAAIILAPRNMHVEVRLVRCYNSYLRLQPFANLHDNGVQLHQYKVCCFVLFCSGN